MRTFLGFIVILIVALGLIGWIMNIVKFAEGPFQAPYKVEILRAIGIPVAPMGAIEGYIHINE